MMPNLSDRMTDADCFNQGKEDAWSGRPKEASAEDPCAASQYDLGYSEGLIRHPHNIVKTIPSH
jgi:hypothetical protein